MRSGRIKLKLYLEGVQTKIVSASVSYGDMTLPVAQIVVPFSKHMMNVRYGTKVHVFEWNFDKEKWQLLFDGVITGVQFVKRSTMRHIVLIATSHGRIWNRVHKFFYHMDDPLAKQHEEKSTGDPNAVAIVNYLDNIISVYGKQGTLYEALANVLTYAGGGTAVYNGQPKAAKATRITNMPKFFKDVLYGPPKLAYRVYGIESVDVIDTMVQFKKTWKLMLGQSTGMQGKATLMQLAMMMMQYGNYMFTSNAQMSPIGAEYVIRPQSMFILPPKCNVVHHKYSSGFIMSRNYDAEPTRAHVTGATLIASLAGTSAARFFNKHLLSPYYIEDKRPVSQEDEYRLSKWELEHGVNYIEQGIPTALSYALDATAPGAAMSELQKYADAIWTHAYLSTRTISAEVDPTLYIIPGAGILLTDGDGGHILAYVASVTKNVSANGQANLVLRLANARHYSEVSEDYASKIDPLFSDNNIAKEYYKYLGTEPAFDSPDTQSVKKMCEKYAEEGQMYERDIIDEDQFCSWLGISNSSDILFKWSGYEPDGGESEFESERYWYEGKIINPNKRELIKLHNDDIKYVGIRG